MNWGLVSIAVAVGCFVALVILRAIQEASEKAAKERQEIISLLTEIKRTVRHISSEVGDPVDLADMFKRERAEI